MTAADCLRAAMDAQGIADNATRAGLAAIAMGESKMQGYTETGYSHTPNVRIRQVFGSRVSALDDDQLNALKSDDRTFFNRVYGSQFSVGQQLGNTQPDDGYNFRGRGFIQLTGRGNYTRYAVKIKRPDIIDTPDLANDPQLAAALAVSYIVDRYRGGGFSQMMASVGNNTPDIAATKQQYFEQFTASGEFDAGAVSVPAPAPSSTAGVADAAIPSAFTMQTALQLAGKYHGALDGIWGPQSSAALTQYYASQPHA